MNTQTAIITRQHWHAEQTSDGLWHVSDDAGHHLRRHFFTAATADQYARRLA
jgi:hypothetical protein